MEIDEKLYIGDRVEMRKKHPCGSHEWTIVRVGADIGLQCCTCERRVLLTRRKFARGAKRFISRSTEEQSNEEQHSEEQSGE